MQFKRKSTIIIKMLFSQTTFIGIDPSAGEKPYNFAAVSQDLQLLALGSGALPDILAFAAGQMSALAAVCGPRQVNLGLMKDEEIRQSLSPAPHPGRYENFRVADYQLRLRNISIPQTPAVETECPNWMRNAFLLFSRLAGFGYRLFPQAEAARQIIEVYPHACFTALLGVIPFHKHTLEGRIQRQLVLRENGIDLPDPMLFFEEITRHRLLSGVLPVENLYNASELDALVAALTAWKAATQDGEAIKIGHPDEGEIYIPVRELKSFYH